LNLAKVCTVAFVGDPALTIWAFCLMTSAGVNMAHETSSASDDAPAWTTAIGRTPLGDEVVVLSRVKRAFVRSYVVKKAPAAKCQIDVMLQVDF
jgi:hypothetical protein